MAAQQAWMLPCCFMPDACPMKTTVEIPDELYRRAKAEAALRGRKFREFVEEGLTHVLNEHRERTSKSRLSRLMKRARG
jgi:hypothetical protein